MAEKGAFLTTTTANRPSVFEVLAQDNLAITIHPALKRVANVNDFFVKTYLVFTFNPPFFSSLLLLIQGFMDGF